MNLTSPPPLKAYAQPKARQAALQELTGASPWDCVIIGGGCVGAGALLEAALRGYRCLLVERSDFAEGTSSRSTKLLHGGVRYLAQGNLALVKEALHERSVILRNAPHVSKPLSFVMACPSWPQALFYRAGLALYDGLAGRSHLGTAALMGKNELHQLFPFLDKAIGRCGVTYQDGVFDDARLVLSLLKTARHYGGIAINHCAASDYQEASGHSRLVLHDRLGNEQFEIQSKIIIDASGAWNGSCLSSRRGEVLPKSSQLAISRGSHIVVDSPRLQSAFVLPKTPDGRILFMVPWRGMTMIGTTDVLSPQAEFSPQVPVPEFDWLLSTASNILDQPLTQDSIKAVFCGFRPLYQPPSQQSMPTAKISREHMIWQTGERMVSIIGGKWTTYRRMAEDCWHRLDELSLLARGQKVNTADISLLASPSLDQWRYADRLTDEIMQKAWEEEWACTPDDLLSRRLRLSFTHSTLIEPYAKQAIGFYAKQEGWSLAQQSIARDEWAASLQQYLPPRV